MSQLAVSIPIGDQKQTSIPISKAGESAPIPLEEPEHPGVTGTVGPVKGFRNNLRLPWASWKEFMVSGPKGALEDNMIVNIIRGVRGNSTEDKLREKYGDATVDDLLAKQKERESGISLSSMKDAFNEDPGAFTASFVNGMIADPELMVTPLGWRTAAVKTAAALKTASTIKKTIAANIAGAAGAATTGAAIMAPVSIVDQIDKTGEVNWDRVGEETMLAAGLAAVLGGAGAKKFPAEKVLEAVESTVGSAQVRAIARTPVGEAVADALGTLKESELSVLGRWAIDKTGGKSITMLDDAAKHSPTFKALRDTIEYTEFSKTPISQSHFERVSNRMGEFSVRLQEIMDKTRTPFLGIIKRADNDAILQGLRGGKKTKISKELRNWLDDVRKYAVEAGVEVGEIADYFPRVYVAKALKKNEDAFLKVLIDHGVDAGEAVNIHKRIIDNGGIYDSAGKLDRIDEFGRKTAKAKNLERGRVLTNIPDEALAPFLENNVYTVLNKYAINSVKRAEFARTFGQGGGKLNKMLKDSIDEMRAAGRPMKAQELNRVYDIADAIQGMYRPHENYAIAKASKVIATYQLVRTLPLAVLSSLTEPLIILSRGHWRSSLKAVPVLFEHTAKSWVRALYKKYPKPEVTLAVERVGVALDDSIGEILTQTFGGESNNITHAFFKATMLSQWTRMNRIWGYHAGRRMVIDNLNDIMNGKKFRFDKMHDELAELGVPVKEGIDWVRRGMPDDDFATNVINNAALRFVNEVVMSPRVTNRPLWHSNPNLHLMAQLKGFQTTFGNTVLKRWFKQIVDDPLYQGPKIASIGAAMTMLAMLVNDLRDQVKGVDRDETTYEKVMRGMDRAGLTGIGQLAMDSLYAHRYGRSGLAQILGPFASQVDALAAATGEAIEGNTNPLKAEAAKAIPLINQSRDARTAVEQALGKE